MRSTDKNEIAPHSKPMALRNNIGFSLLEIMVVIAVIAILASIAGPSYFEYVERSRLSKAQADMYEMAQTAERFFSVNRNYDLQGAQIQPSNDDYTLGFAARNVSGVNDGFLITAFNDNKPTFGLRLNERGQTEVTTNSGSTWDREPFPDRVP